ncbi:MAG TPA: nucleotidyltransferase family protein [Acidobacteriaceae bacterium]|jgi:hypothetical protein|nr:nucleotidyltransferase family protein [Acidobacteriaceae bacterium]
MRAQLIGNGLLMARLSEHRAAVLAALQLQGASTEALLSFDDAAWQQVLTFCDRMKLTLPLALRSSRGFPVWVNERLMENLTNTARRFVSVQATYREMAAALDCAGVPHLVLKGFTQSPDFVKAPQCRMQSDIDLYTDTAHIPAGVQALEGIGYESSGTAETYRQADHVPTLTRYREWRPGSSPYDPEMPLAIDLHYCLWNAAVSMIQLPEMEDFWKRRIERKLGELSFPALARVDHLGYFALHMLRDLFAGAQALHQALELATFLHERTDDVVFWTEWQALHSPRLRRMEALSFALAGAVFSSRLPEAIHEEIARLPAQQRRWIETCGGNLLATTFARNRDGRLLQFLLADSPAMRRKILWNAVLPTTISSPQSVASWPEHAVMPQLQHRRWLGRYPAYLVSRISLNSAAIFRLVANGLLVFLSSFTLRRNAARY